MAQPIDLEGFVFHSRPQAGHFERHFRTRVKNSAISFIRDSSRAGGFAVIGQTPSGSWGDVEPTEKRLGQQKLVESIGTGGFIIQPGRGAKNSGIFSESASIIARGGLALVIKRGSAQFLAVTGG